MITVILQSALEAVLVIGPCAVACVLAATWGMRS
jgi:hypothetical protein